MGEVMVGLVLGALGCYIVMQKLEQRKKEKAAAAKPKTTHEYY